MSFCVANASALFACVIAFTASLACDLVKRLISVLSCGNFLRFFNESYSLIKREIPSASSPTKNSPLLNHLTITGS